MRMMGKEGGGKGLQLTMLLKRAIIPSVLASSGNRLVLPPRPCVAAADAWGGRRTAWQGFDVVE